MNEYHDYKTLLLRAQEFTSSFSKEFPSDFEAFIESESLDYALESLARRNASAKEYQHTFNVFISYNSLLAKKLGSTYEEWCVNLDLLTKKKT